MKKILMFLMLLSMGTVFMGAKGCFGGGSDESDKDSTPMLEESMPEEEDVMEEGESPMEDTEQTQEEDSPEENDAEDSQE